MKTHWKKCFNKDYLGSHDLDEAKDLKAVIDHVEVRSVKDSSGKDGKCNVAVFQGSIKPMILNVTNCKKVKKFSGSNYIEDWNNVAITICVKTITAFGEDVEALRIRDSQPKMTKPKLTPEHQAWPKAVEHMKKPESTLDSIKVKYTISDAHAEQLLSEAL